jgi:hypothetical protein
MKAKFHHFGVPTTVKAGKETYLDGAGVYITDPESHPYSVEFLRFDANSPMPDALKKTPHAAFVVESSISHQRQAIILPPTEVTDPACGLHQDGDARKSWK